MAFFAGWGGEELAGINPDGVYSSPFGGRAINKYYFWFVRAAPYLFKSTYIG